MFVLFSVKLFAQTTLNINGEVFNEKNIAIGQANIILKTKTDSIIAFTTTNDKGFFQLTTSNQTKQFILEVRSLGFEKQKIELQNEQSKVNLHFVLKASTILLEPVNVISKTAAVKINNDTTTYKVSEFLSGGEDVVEDILKKLPGIEVNDNGKITYKGKEITKVLIEGDDLFSNDYQIGTKNIKSAIISEVQAIENYTDNSKLAGLAKSNESVLNLKVKNNVKNKPNLSAAIGYGVNDSYDADINLIGISKTVKYFLQGSTNNIGINPTPFDYYTFQNNTPELQDIADLQKKLINLYYTLPVLKPQRGYINNTKFASGNIVFKPTKKVTITGNNNFYADKLNFTETSNTLFSGLQDNFNFIENQKIKKSPILGGGYIKILVDLSKKNNIAFHTDYNAENTHGMSGLDANYGTYSSVLLDKNYVIKEKIDYTSRLSSNSALTLNLNLFKANQVQNYTLNPGLQVIDSTLAQNEQIIKLKNKGIELRASYFLKQGLISQSLDLQLARNTSNIGSQLYYSELDNQNALNYTVSNLHVGYINTLNLNKLKLSAGLTYNIKEAVDENQISPALKARINYFAPTINFDYTLNEYDKLASNFSYDQSLPLATDLLPNYLLTDNRTLSKGLYAINPQSTKSLILTFIHADLFNQFIYYLTFIYVDNNMAYGNAQTINFNYFINDRIIVPGTKNYILAVSFSKYLPFISSTIKYTSNLSWFKFYNQINSSPLKENIAFNNGQKLELKSGFISWLNFELGGKYLYNKFKTNFPAYTNNNTNIESYFNLLIKPSDKLFISIINEQYFTNVGQNNPDRYFFMDLNLRFTAKRISYKIIGNNLLNNQFYNTKMITGNSITYERNGLLPAKLLLEVEYRFM